MSHFAAPDAFAAADVADHADCVDVAGVADEVNVDGGGPGWCRSCIGRRTEGLHLKDCC
jgi:hypothetical protein